MLLVLVVREASVSAFLVLKDLGVMVRVVDCCWMIEFVVVVVFVLLDFRQHVQDVLLILLLVYRYCLSGILLGGFSYCG